MLLNKERKRSLQAVKVARPAHWATRESRVALVTSRAARRSDVTPQRHAGLALAVRARYALADRRVAANLRRRRRVELQDEISRLSRLLRELQEQIDRATRRVEATERLAAHFERVSQLLQEATAQIDGEAAEPSPASAAAAVAPAAAEEASRDGERERTEPVGEQ